MLLKNWVFILVLVVLLAFVKRSTENSYTLEFGSVFGQRVTWRKSQAEKQEYTDLIQWTEQYIEQRSPWSCPWSWEQTREEPEVSAFTKVNLLYTQNDVEPFYYDSSVNDRDGLEHGISRIVTLGSIYRFILLWRKKHLNFIHNLTVSVYPKNKFNIYSHTFFIENVNSTSSSKGKVLLPKFKGNHLKQTSYFEKVSDIGKFFDSNFANAETLIYDKLYSKPEHLLNEQTPLSCDENGENCDKSSFENRYFKSRQDNLTVMSYNIWNMNSSKKRDGAYTERMNKLKQTIKGASPDIIGLQEVRYQEMKGEELGPSQIHTLSDWLQDYQFIFQPAQMQPNSVHEGRTEEGVAILSKYPIISHNYVLLFLNISNSADSHQRILLHAEIIVPRLGKKYDVKGGNNQHPIEGTSQESRNRAQSTKVHVLNTHLSLSHEAREKSVVQIQQFVANLKGPVILVGDMNAEPNEPAMKYLSGQDLLPGTEEMSSLRDMWLENAGNKDGFTFNCLKGKLHKRIDYILHAGLEPVCKFRSIKVLDDGNRGSKAASDHCPLMATFTFYTRENAP